MHTPSKSAGRKKGRRLAMIRAMALRTLLFTLIWWALSEELWKVPLPGGFFILVSAWTSLHFIPPGRWVVRVGPLLRFIPYFLLESFLAGLDVSRRALTPRLPVQPALLRHPLTLRSEPARVFLVWIVSLLPGTASVRLEQDSITVHVLMRSQPHRKMFSNLEQRIAGLFGEKSVEK